MAETDKGTVSMPELATALRTLSTAVLVTDVSYHCAFANESAERLIGLSNAMLHRRRIFDFLQRSVSPDFPEFAALLTSRQPVQGLASIVHANAPPTPVTFAARAIWDDAQAVGVSIELWLQQEAASPERDTNQITLADQSPTAITILRGPEHRFVMANPAYYQLVGHRDIIGRTVREAVPEAASQGFIDLLDGVYRTGIPFAASKVPILLQRTPNGPLDERILDFVYSPLYEAGTGVAGILVHAIDITDTIRAQEQYALAEAHYRRLVTNAPQLIYAVNAHGLITEINPAGERMLHRSSADLVGRHFGEVIVRRDLDAAHRTFAKVISGQTDSTEIEAHIMRPGGEIRLLQITMTAIKDQAGNISGLHGIARDITDERVRDEQMRLVMHVLHQLEQGVALLDDQLQYRYINPAGAKLLGISPETPEQYHLDQFIAGMDAEERTRLIAELHATGQWSGRVQRRRLSDGQIVPLDLVKGVVTAADGKRLYFDLFQDASKAIAQEQQLRRAERLASLGTLIGGVAHELNNPLTTIIALCELLLLAPERAGDDADLTTILHEANRMARIVADLRMSVRQTQDERHKKKPFDLNAVVRHVLSTQAYTLQARAITVETDLEPNIPLIYGDGGQLEQILINLIVNAEQALEGWQIAPRLTLRTFRTAIGAAVEVIDNGIGIEPANVERLFDPFFTTKAPGEGVGLGLALVNSLVQEHGGTIEVESALGSGACFRVDLCAAPIGATLDPLIDEQPPQHPLRLLVIDDELPIRTALTRFLAQRGHDVDAAANGQAALELLDQQRYDCILSDLRMPEMSGEQLAQILLARGLASKLIVITGDVSNVALIQQLRAAGVPVLLKPLAPVDVAHAIEERANGEHNGI